MPYVKIGPKHQVTIPKEVFEALKLEVGDIVEVVVRNGQAVIIPKRMVEKAPAPKLTPKQQELLKSARAKIAAIQQDPKTAKGLTQAEADVAAKVGLIDPDQRWWWTEDWQRGEREAQRDIEQGEVEQFDSPEGFLKALRS